jgi:hypothetical protein
MTDVQESNARRVGFTALALVAFWVVAWREYDLSWNDISCSCGHGALRIQPLGNGTIRRLTASDTDGPVGSVLSADLVLLLELQHHLRPTW